MTASFKDAARFIHKPFAPTSVTMHYIDSQALETPADVLSLLNMIADNCHLLQSLGLVSTIDTSIMTDQPPKAGIDTLKPLFQCPNLNALWSINTPWIYDRMTSS
jgi:hypothetical protein